MKMKTCTWIKDIEAYVDGESRRDTLDIEKHLADCALCTEHHDSLLHVRAALGSLAAKPVLSDNQFPAFMEGIHENIGAGKRHPRNFWAILSLSAAALVISIATFSIFSESDPVRANEVESVSTQIQGATVHWDNSDDGVTTIWISVAEDDV